MPKVAIIIVTYNARQYLDDCLLSLKKINYPLDDFKVVIVDNNSQDDTVSHIQNNFSEFHLISLDKNLGFAGGNNVGFEFASKNNYDYVFALNQDTAVDPNFLIKAVELAQSNNQIGAVQSKLLLHGQPDKVNSTGNHIHYLGFAYAGGHQTPDQKINISKIAYPSGAAVLYRMSALAEVGFFDEELFLYHEDTDLGWRLWLAGWQCILSPESIVYHKYEFSRSISKYYFMERNRYIVMLQNYHLATLIIILPMLLVVELMMFGYSFTTGWWREKLRAIIYFFGIKNWQRILKNRKRVQNFRKVKDQQIVKRFVSVINFQEIKNPLVNLIFNPLCSVYWSVIRRVIFW
jgi:GT2 family glycosyltransferase